MKVIGQSVNVCYVENRPIGFLLCQWSHSATMRGFQLQRVISQSEAKENVFSSILCSSSNGPVESQTHYFFGRCFFCKSRA